MSHGHQLGCAELDLGLEFIHLSFLYVEFISPLSSLNFLMSPSTQLMGLHTAGVS